MPNLDHKLWEWLCDFAKRHPLKSGAAGYVVVRVTDQVYEQLISPIVSNLINWVQAFTTFS